MIELLELRMTLEDDLWHVYYSRVENGERKDSRYGPFASRAVANQQYWECHDHYTADKAPGSEVKYAGIPDKRSAREGEE